MNPGLILYVLHQNPVYIILRLSERFRSDLFGHRVFQNNQNFIYQSGYRKSILISKKIPRKYPTSCEGSRAETHQILQNQHFRGDCLRQIRLNPEKGERTLSSNLRLERISEKLQKGTFLSKKQINNFSISRVVSARLTNSWEGGTPFSTLGDKSVLRRR